MYTNLGLIGKPLSHTLSPSIHSKFLNSSKINGGYVCFEAENKDVLADLFTFLKLYNFRGVNVTVPYKEDILPFLDELDPLASDLSAVNTIFFDGGKSKGFNTDVYGFVKTLEINNLSLNNSSVLMLGCGGAAKAVLRCLKDFKGLELTVVNRNIGKVEEVLDALKISDTKIFGYEHINKKNSYDLVINSTSIGLDGTPFIDMSNIECKTGAIDLQYKPWTTPFLDCYKSKCRIINGFSMLVYQAQQAFKIWTGVEAPVDMAEFNTLYNG